MGSQEYVAWQGAQLRKRVLKVLSDLGSLRDGRVWHEVVLRPKTRTTDDDDIPHRSRCAPLERRAHRPCGTSARMAGGFVGCQSHIPQGYRVPVMENAINVYRSVCGDVR